LASTGIITVNAPINSDSYVLLNALDDGVGPAARAELAFRETVTSLSQIEYGWKLGTGGTIPEGTLVLDNAVAGVAQQTIIRVAPNPRGGGGIPVANAIFGFHSLAQRGTATIALGSDTVAVAQPSITANSIVMVTAKGAPDATATSFNVVLNAGVGFSITANANATAAKTVDWFIVCLS
jgi:hypothetical protein